LPVNVLRPPLQDAAPMMGIYSHHDDIDVEGSREKILELFLTGCGH
jgi:hypothetical protein